MSKRTWGAWNSTCDCPDLILEASPLGYSGSSHGPCSIIMSVHHSSSVIISHHPHEGYFIYSTYSASQESKTQKNMVATRHYVAPYCFPALAQPCFSSFRTLLYFFLAALTHVVLSFGGRTLVLAASVCVCVYGINEIP